MEDNFVGFLGRFHPLIVHLPIGFLIMSGLLQLYAAKVKNNALNLNPAIAFTLLWGTIASIFAVAIGWLLSQQGGYDSNILFWHKWLGILVTLLSFFGWLIKTERIRLQKSSFSIVLFLIIILISVSGHLGGSLTHGEAYLMHYAPKFIKNMVGEDTKENLLDLKTLEKDSIKFFPHIIQPIFNNKCISCHNPTKKEGGLLLTTYSEVIAGGDHGSIINLKTPLESALLNRVTLPKSHRKFMPPRGAALTFGEIQIIEWWMQNGADSLSSFSTEKALDKKMIYTLLRDYQLDYNPKMYYESVKVAPLSSNASTVLRQNNFAIDFMGEDNNFISVTFKGKSITDDQISKLELAKTQITWLKMSNCNLTDAQLKSISSLNNLTRLNIHSNPISDENIKSLSALKHLISLNLYNTKITDLSLEHLVNIQSLTTLYVWRTGITAKAITDRSSTHSQVAIISELK